MVNLNTREDLYPEYPIIEGMKMNKGIKNVFECLYDDDDDQKTHAIEVDSNETFNFSLIHLTNKCDEEQNRIQVFLNSKYN